MQTAKLTEGEYRVGKSFNPSANPQVDDIKAIAAELIDIMEAYSSNEMHPGAEAAKDAIKHFETGAMFAVKAVTKQPR